MKTYPELLIKSTAKQQLLRSSARVQYSPSTAKERKKCIHVNAMQSTVDIC